MVKNVLASIPGIEYYPIVALILFVTFFAGLLIWFVRADKRRLDAVSRLPLDDGHSETIVPKGGLVS